MEEYQFKIVGNEYLLVPTGTGESGSLSWCPHYEDKRVKDIEALAGQFSGDITSKGDFFTPVAGKRKTLSFDASFSPEGLRLFEIKLRLKGYSVFYTRLSTEEIQQRDRLKAEAQRALELAQERFFE